MFMIFESKVNEYVVILFFLEQNIEVFVIKYPYLDTPSIIFVLLRTNHLLFLFIVTNIS